MKILQKIKYCYLGICLLPLVVSNLGVDVFSVPKNAFFMFMLGIGLIMLGLKVSIQGWHNYRKVNWFFIILTSLIVVGNILSISPIQSFFGDYNFIHGSFTLLLLILHSWILIQLFDNKKEQKVIIQLAIAVGVIVSVIGLLQAGGINLVQNDANNNFLGRVYSTVGHPNFLGQYLIFPLALSIYKIHDLKKNRIGTLFYTIAALIILFAIFFTFNKATLLAILIVLALLFLKETKIKYTKKVALIVIAVSVGILAIYLLDIDFRSFYSRVYLWKGGLNLIPDNLLFGSGMHTYYREAQTVLSSNIFNYEPILASPTRVHNEFLEIIIENGVIMAGLYLYVIYYLVTKRFKKSMSKACSYGILAYLISVQFSFQTIEGQIMMFTFCYLIIVNEYKSNLVILANKTYQKVVTYSCFSLVGISILLFSCRYFSSSIYTAKAIEGMFYKQEIAQYYFDKSVKSSMFYAEPYRTSLHFLLPSNDEDKILVDQYKKYANNYKLITADDHESLVYQIQVSALDKDFEMVDKLFKEGRDKYPVNAKLYIAVGDIYYEIEAYDKAVESYSGLLSLIPEYISEKNTDYDKNRIFFKTNSVFVRALNDLIIAYENIGRFEEADILYRKLYE